jgi:hypothetical protein
MEDSLLGLRLPAPLTMLVLAIVLAASLTGCAAEETTFIDNSASYDATSVMKMADGIDASKLAKTPSKEAIALRHQALTSLRSRGGAAVPVADMMTRTFSAETRAVPIYFERATFGGRPAVVVVEAAGPANGALSTKRVWVLDEQGGVIFLGSR